MENNILDEIDLDEKCSPIKMDDGRVLKCQLYSEDKKKGKTYIVYFFPEIKSKEDLNKLPEFNKKSDYTILPEKEIKRLRGNYLSEHYDEEQQFKINTTISQTKHRCLEKLNSIKTQYEEICKYANNWNPVNNFSLDAMSMKFVKFYQPKFDWNRSFFTADSIVEYFCEQENTKFNELSKS